MEVSTPPITASPIPDLKEATPPPTEVEARLMEMSETVAREVPERRVDWSTLPEEVPETGARAKVGVRYIPGGTEDEEWVRVRPRQHWSGVVHRERQARLEQ